MLPIKPKAKSELETLKERIEELKQTIINKDRAIDNQGKTIQAEKLENFRLAGLVFTKGDYIGNGKLYYRDEYFKQEARIEMLERMVADKQDIIDYLINPELLIKELEIH